MSDADAATPATPTKSPKKKTPKPKKPANHPKYNQMIRDAVTDMKERGGSSRQALLKYIIAHYNVGKDEKTVNNHLKLALRAGVLNGTLKQSKGTGASGSFKLGDKAEKATKLKAKVKKPKVAKPKSPTKATKKPAAKAKKASAKKVKSPAKKAAPKKAGGKAAKAKKASPKKAAKKQSKAKKSATKKSTKK